MFFVLEGTEDIFDSWYKMFTEILDFLILVKEKRVKKKSAQVIWFTSEINEVMRKRDKLLKKARVSDSPAGLPSNVLKMRNADKQYFKKQFTEHENNPKRLWNLIRNLTRQDVNKHAPIRQLKEGAKFCTDPRVRDIAECLNRSVCKAAP